MLDSLLCKINIYIYIYIYCRYLSSGLRFLIFIFRKCVGCWSQTYFITLRQPELILGQIDPLINSCGTLNTTTHYYEYEQLIQKPTPQIWIIIRTGTCTRWRKKFKRFFCQFLRLQNCYVSFLKPELTLQILNK